jgi:hypothetical protein
MQSVLQEELSELCRVREEFKDKYGIDDEEILQEINDLQDEIASVLAMFSLP